MRTHAVILILIFFVIWRVWLFFIAYASSIAIADFGGRFPYYGQVLENTKLPNWIWGFGNFDGVHYLRLAQNGYDAQYSQAFFPGYSMIIRSVTNINVFTKQDELLDKHTYVDPAYFLNGFLLSQVCFFLSLVVLYKLLRLDFTKQVSTKSIILLLLFPTSYYFVSVYTESVFFLLLVSFFWFLRKREFLWAGIIGALASSSRLIGVLMIVPAIIELVVLYKENQSIFYKRFFTPGMIMVLIIPAGFLLYMLFLKIWFDNPLYFLTAQPFFGAERSGSGIITLPQVIVRYIRIFLTVKTNSLIFFNAFLEFIITLGVFSLIALFWRRIRLSYLIFIALAILLPTLSGTLSSMPRYVLIAFPLLPLVVLITGRKFIYVLIIMAILQVVLVSMFVRGYWVA